MVSNPRHSRGAHVVDVGALAIITGPPLYEARYARLIGVGRHGASGDGWTAPLALFAYLPVLVRANMTGFCRRTSTSSTIYRLPASHNNILL